MTPENQMAAAAAIVVVVVVVVVVVIVVVVVVVVVVVAAAAAVSFNFAFYQLLRQTEGITQKLQPFSCKWCHIPWTIELSLCVV